MEFPFISQNKSPLLVAFESHSNVVNILLTDNFRTESKPIHNGTCNTVAAVVTLMPLEKQIDANKKTNERIKMNRYEMFVLELFQV